ncbi:MAG: hypothetical protein ACRDPY_42595 [Streptosporangiaceae bacterium]
MTRTVADDKPAARLPTSAVAAITLSRACAVRISGRYASASAAFRTPI